MDPLLLPLSSARAGVSSGASHSLKAKQPLLVAAAIAAAVSSSAGARGQWVGTWGSAQIALDSKSALQSPASGDVTIRQLIRATTGGTRIRLRISNAFGSAPLEIAGIHVARAGSAASSAIDQTSDRTVTFGKARSISIPPGAEYLSDPIELNVPALTTLAVSIHLAELPKAQTGHPGSRATSYFAAGDQLSAPNLHGSESVDHWYYLSGLDVETERPSAAIAIVGDSITDGHGVVSNTDTRWTDFLAERLKKSPGTRSLAVLNLGIGANCLVRDCVGPNVAARFGRDVLVRSAVRYLIILEGVNDLGTLSREAPVSAEEHKALVARMIAAYAQLAAQAREHGIKVIGATIMPYGSSGYYHPDAANEADRQAINAWIRAPGHFDAVVDFDALMRDPAEPSKLRTEFDSGDGLHPSAAGYRFMGEAVPLAFFTNGKRR